MADAIRLSSDLSLPLEAIGETFGILAARGAGKSNTAAVMAEEFFRCGLPFVVVDPVGAWWGLRSNAAGDGAGLAIPIFGGKKGDVPLEKNAGTMIADLIVDQRLSCVLDLSTFDSEGSKKHFLLDFARRLYARNEEPLHLFLEEADDYIPQRPLRDEAQLLRAWENIVRRGRARGLGLTLITQRSAVLNKNVLTQVQTLIALRTTGPQDRAAIAEWVKYHDQSSDILASLSGLGNGEAWVWSPQFLQLTKRVQIDRRQTFDSGSTPKMHKGKRPAATLADVDLGKLRERMAETIEKAKADDPRELQRQVRELTRQLQSQQPTADQGAIDQAVLDAVQPLNAKIDKYEFLFEEVSGLLDRIKGLFDTELLLAKHEAKRKQPPPRRKPTVTQSAPRPSMNGALNGPQARVVNAVAWWNAIGVENPDKLQVAFVAGYKPNTGSFNNTLGSLRSAGLIDYPTAGQVVLTPNGSRHAQMPTIAGDLDGFHEAVLAKLNGPQRRLLEPLIASYPQALTTEALATAAGYAPNTGSFNNTRGSLRSLGLIGYPASGTVVALDVLFPRGLQ